MAPEFRDLVADWKRWRVAERVIALVVVALLVLALALAVALIGN
jgi:hypothetical protein